MDPNQALTELPWTEMKIAIAIIVAVALVALSLISVSVVVFIRVLAHQKDMINGFLNRQDKHVLAYIAEGKANRKHCREEMSELQNTHRETMASLTAATQRLSEIVEGVHDKVDDIHRTVVRSPAQNVFKGESGQ